MRESTIRVLVVVAGLGNALVGLWASVAPHSFYDDFPGAGRHWVAVDGPFNEHLVRDVGTLNLAVAAVAVAALVWGSRELVQTFAVAELLYAVPHLAYHLRHLDRFGAGDKVALVVSLGIGVFAPIALLVFSSRVPKRSMTRAA